MTTHVRGVTPHVDVTNFKEENTMMRTIRLHTIGALLLGLLVVYCPLSAFAVIIVSFDAPVTNVAPGDMFSVDLVADVDSGMAITSFGLDVTFDPAILDTDSAVVPTPIPFVGSLVDTTMDGVIKLTGFGPPGPGLSGLLLLATLTFTAEMAGMTALDLAFPDFPVLDGFGLAAGGVALPDAVMPGQVNVTGVIPEPSTFLLVGLGLAALLGCGSRKRKQTA